MEPTKNSVIWASSRFGEARQNVRDTEIVPASKSISMSRFLRNLLSIRLLLNASKFADARAKLDDIYSSSLDEIPAILLAVLAELQVAIEVHEGHYEKAVFLYEQMIIPAYEGMPKVLGNRARLSLVALNTHIRNAA